MRNTIGTCVILTLSGESHGEAVVAVLDGMAPGIPVSEEVIAAELSKRRPSGPTETARVEKDEFRILSGVFNGFTTGSPITILIPNGDVRSSDYEKDIPRPSHADFVARERFRGFEDYRGGGHFSGRITVGIVAAGAIALKALEMKGISVSTSILSCGGVEDGISSKILETRLEGDSLGGITQTIVTGLPAGIGEPWFDSLEGSISRAMFGIGGIKGIEFGLGFGLTGLRGSQANDPFRIENGKVITTSNNNGGINGGLSNGMPVVFKCAVKPTPSISIEQESVNMASGENCTIRIKGRHDPAIIRRICPIITGLTAIILCDMIALRSAQDSLNDTL